MKRILLVFLLLNTIALFSQDSLTYCDCVKMSKGPMPEECKSIFEDWRATFNGAPEVLQLAMMEEHHNCLEASIDSLESKDLKSVKDYSQKELCFCGELIVKLFKAKPNNQFEEFLKNNKIEADSAKVIFNSFNDENIILFFKQLMKCETLKKHFKDPSHPLYMISVQFEFNNSSVKNKDTVTVCDCVNGYKEMLSKMKEADGDEAKITLIELEYRGLEIYCNKLDEGMSNEEKKVLNEEANNCKEENGNFKITLCECVNGFKELGRKMIKADGGVAIMKLFELEYSELERNCNKHHEGLSNEEMKVLNEESNNCKEENGNFKITLCECVNGFKELSEKMIEADGDVEKIRLIELEYRVLEYYCNKLKDKKSDREVREIIKNCPEEKGDSKKKIDLDVCDCMKVFGEMKDKMKETDGDKDKMEAVEAEYREILEQCNRLENGKTEEEMKILIEEAKKCREANSKKKKK